MSHFNGPDYNPKHDQARLTAQHDRVRAAMLDKSWRTLYEISRITKDPEASISAQLRHLRKPRFGSYVLEKRPRGDRSIGLFEYRLLPPGSGPKEVSVKKEPALVKLKRYEETLKKIADGNTNYVIGFSGFAKLAQEALEGPKG